MHISQDQLPHPVLKKRQILHTEYIGACGTFGAFYKAEALVKDMGYITGSMERQQPIGFAPRKDVAYISKWTNMNTDDRMQLHGVLLPDSGFREGGVVIVFFEPPIESLIGEVPFE